MHCYLNTLPKPPKVMGTPFLLYLPLVLHYIARRTTVSYYAVLKASYITHYTPKSSLMMDARPSWCSRQKKDGRTNRHTDNHSRTQRETEGRKEGGYWSEAPFHASYTIYRASVHDSIHTLSVARKLQVIIKHHQV